MAEREKKSVAVGNVGDVGKSDQDLKLRREVRRLGELQPHPLQSSFFDDLPEDGLCALANDIKLNGLKHPIEILPANTAGLPPDTILAGHQRKLALEKNGETRTEVIVRHDLATADAATIEACFLGDNQYRRHSDTLARARVAHRLFELHKKKPCNRLGFAEQEELRDRIGKIIDMSGRNLNRYLNVLRAPIEAQNAFRNRKISLMDAEKVGRLRASIQEQIAQRLRAGEPPLQVLADYVTLKKSTHKNAKNAVMAFIRGVERAIEDLADRTGTLSSVFLFSCLPELKRTQEFVSKLIARAKKPDKASGAQLKSMCAYAPQLQRRTN